MRIGDCLSSFVVKKSQSRKSQSRYLGVIGFIKGLFIFHCLKCRNHAMRFTHQNLIFTLHTLNYSYWEGWRVFIPRKSLSLFCQVPFFL